MTSRARRRGALLSLLLGASLPAAMARADTVAEGELAYSAKHYDVARTIWTGLAESGNPEAAYRLAILYERGDSVAANLARAVCWYRNAASGGVAPAVFNVAVMNDGGRGVPQDAAAAAVWYARAAAFGLPRAEYNLGQLYETGDGVPRNLDMAAAWYRAAALAEITAASDQLATLGRPAVPDPAALPVPVRLDEPFPTTAAGLASGVPLTWTAVPQRLPVSYYVEVMATKPASPRPVFSATTSLSAALAPLPPGHYAGRVVVVAADSSHYAVGDWTEFSAGTATASPTCPAPP